MCDLVCWCTNMSVNLCNNEFGSLSRCAFGIWLLQPTVPLPQLVLNINPLTLNTRASCDLEVVE